MNRELLAGAWVQLRVQSFEPRGGASNSPKPLVLGVGLSGTLGRVGGLNAHNKDLIRPI